MSAESGGVEGAWGDAPEMPWDRPWRGRPLAELRWQLELLRLFADPVAIGRGVPRGDRRAVLLCPGFGAGDQTLGPLAGWLRLIGYRPALAGFTLNADCGDRAFERVERRAERLAAETGRRIAIVGHSRGGHYARALGARRPDLISHAVSLGAGLRVTLAVSHPTLAALGLARTAAAATGRARDPGCLTKRCQCDYSRSLHGPFPASSVRLASIYSKGDGVVHWQSAVVPEAECVEVSGSHIGLVFNRKVYRELGVILATPELPVSRAPLRTELARQ